MEQLFVLRGHIVHTPAKDDFSVHEHSYLVCEGGKVAGIFDALPERYAACMVYDFGDSLIVPGFCDTHLHAPQYAYRGLGMDLELIEWLNTHAFPEEMRYRDLAYASRAYRLFADDLKKSATTRACVFATVHNEATLMLMRLMDETGLQTYVGKVNMDRNAPEGLLDPEGQASVELTRKWLKDVSASGLRNTLPILTPRFVPSCTNELLKGLGELAKEDNLPVQSHLSENLGEIKWVRELCPQASCYLDVYAQNGLAGAKTIMAHCVHPTDEEFALLLQRDVLVSHCPSSNTNLCSGIAPIRRYLDAGVRVSLGTDIAGGYDISMPRAVADAVRVSKLRARMTDMREKPITLPEAFYMATKGGGTFFGKVGSFENGYAFDALVLDDSRLRSPLRLTVRERLERAIYLEKDVSITLKLVNGEPVNF